MDTSWLTLDRNDTTPLYLQLCGALQTAIASGIVGAGSRLPSERDLALQLGISRTTAVNAYRELEARGLVRGYVGRGTFVAAGPEPGGAPFAWRGKVSVGALRTEDPGLRWLARSAGDPEAISFAAAVAARECFPVDAYRETIDDVLRKHGVSATVLVPTEGLPELRRAIASRHKVHPAQVLVLNGAQQGLDLISRCLLDPGDAVIIDRPGYLGAIQVFRAAGAHLVGWDVERADFDELEDLIVRYRPKMLYTNPTFQNPTGQTMPVPARRDLLDMAARYRLPVVEDDPYSELGFQQKPPSSLFDLDDNQLVIHIGTFSKILAGGMRVGWLVAGEAIVDQLALIKQRNDVASPTLSQMVISEFLVRGHLDRHLADLRTEHLRRYRTMCAAIERHMSPAALSYAPVDGGMYLWCATGAGIDTTVLLQQATAAGVLFVNGEQFHVDGGGRHQLRLCFTSVPPAVIERGVKILADLLHNYPARDVVPGTIPVAR